MVLNYFKDTLEIGSLTSSQIMGINIQILLIRW